MPQSKDPNSAMSEPKHPIQPLVVDDHGVLRFKANRIVRDLLDFATPRGFSLNQICGPACNYSAEDKEQLAQLIGYSHSGSPSYLSTHVYDAAAQMYENGLTEDKARIAALEAELQGMRAAADELRGPVALLLGMHPDDLKGDA